MDEYVKQLEARNEQLEKQLSTSLSALAAINLYNRKLVFFTYGIEVRKDKGEWFLWQYSEEKHDVFSAFGDYSSTLFEFDELSLRGTRTMRDPINEVKYVWDRRIAWRIDLRKEKDKRGNDMWTIVDYFNVADYLIPEETRVNPIGMNLKEYLHRRHRIKMGWENE